MMGLKWYIREYLLEVRPGMVGSGESGKGQQGILTRLNSTG